MRKIFGKNLLLGTNRPPFQQLSKAGPSMSEPVVVDPQIIDVCWFQFWDRLASVSEPLKDSKKRSFTTKKCFRFLRSLSEFGHLRHLSTKISGRTGYHRPPSPTCLDLQQSGTETL